LIFNLNNFLKLIFCFIVYYIILNSIIQNFYINVQLIDIPARLDLNSMGLAGLYWLWTNTYYLYSLLILPIIIYMLYTTYNINYVVTLLTLLYLLLLISEIMYNVNLINTNSLYIDNLLFYNLLLNNSINKIHPLLIYFSWLYLSIYILYHLNANILYSNLQATLVMSTTILISLFLGGWWAYQEGSWGGWWNWDASEMFGLLIMLILVKSLHNIKDINFIYLEYIRNIVLLSIIYYSFLQFNFSLISHNFGIRQGDVSDFRVFYLLYTAIILLVLSYNIKAFTSIYLLAPNGYIKPIIYILLISILLITILYVTTSELWSSLLWNLLSIDLQNSNKLLLSINLSLILGLVSIYISSVSYFALIILICSIYLVSSTTILILIVFIMLGSNNLASIHKYVLLLFLIILQYSTFSLVSWANIANNLVNLTAVLNLPLIESELSNSSIYSNLLYSNISSSLITNSTETKGFVLTSLNSTTIQSYTVNSDDIIVGSTTLDNFNTISVLMILLYFLLAYYFKTFLSIIKY
jgi:hypothetical protein